MGAGQKTYLALGDSMSIDDYTGVPGGGAANQFLRSLGSKYSLNDFTFDGCTIPQVPAHHHGDIITITIGGNDALQRIDELLGSGVSRLASDHLRLLCEIRENNPESCIIVGNIYESQERLPDNLLKRVFVGGTFMIGGRMKGCRLFIKAIKKDGKWGRMDHGQHYPFKFAIIRSIFGKEGTVKFYE